MDVRGDPAYQDRNVFHHNTMAVCNDPALKWSARTPGQTLDRDLIVEVKDAGFLFNVSPVYFYDSLLKLLCFLDLELISKY